MIKKIEIRQIKEKQLLIEEMRKTPVIEIVCKKNSVGRATYYRWRKEDSRFAGAADEALREGESKISDLAESRLISAIQEGNMTGIIFWLKNHNPKYADSKTEINVGDNRKIIVTWANGEPIDHPENEE
jgi:hypothetical protein